jgi:cytosine/adenosine deaminase-related metal-dependent hydrolase
MATIGGAAALGWDGLVGSLEKGKRADLIAVRLQGRHGQPEDERNRFLSGEEVVESLVANASASDIGTVMVEGRVAFENPAAEQRRSRVSASSPEMEREAVSDALLSVREKLGLEDG